ncbi:MAG TPA: HAMP domain-containing sensor histidine kinase, partial [Chloroflexota bacterium]|nr:HAMP domain-containing sensor histidine kinase [Chloroflexota bacterium]
MPGTPEGERSSRTSSKATRTASAVDNDAPHTTAADLDWSSVAGVVMSALPDALVVCDRFLSPLLANDAGTWLLLKEGGWSHHPAVEQVQAAVAAALDRRGVSTVAFTVGTRLWEARATPVIHGQAAAVVLVHATDDLDERQRDAILRRAHDLKAPLHAIDGFTTVLLRQTTGRLNPRQRHMLEITAAEVRRFRALLERLLDLARTGGVAENDYPRAEGDDDTTLVSDVLKRAVDRLSGASGMQRVHVQLHVGCEARVSMPPDEVTTVVENLLTNALNALSQGGEIVLSVDLHSEDTLRWTCHDTGPGIPDATL